MAALSDGPSTYAAEAAALVDAMAESGRLSRQEECAARHHIAAGDATAALTIVTRCLDTDRAR